MATISKEAQAEIAKSIDKVTADEHNLPGAVAVSVNKNGEVIFAHASGKRGLGSEEPMTLDSTFWIASCTKMICAVAVMQLVEAGRLSLDDANQLEQLLPELRKVNILTDVSKTGAASYREKKTKITLRMLLSHTAGFGYSFFDHRIKASRGAEGWDEFSGDADDILEQPLVNEPGEKWQYGVNIDWAGLAVERTTGRKLNDYFQQYIFKPLGITKINMFPGEEMKKHLAYLHQRSGPQLRVRDHLHRRALSAKHHHHSQIFNSAGAGCFAQPAEYTKILAALLNDGLSPTTGHRILRKESVDELLKNQIPQFPQFGRVPIPDAKPDLTNPIPELYAQPHDQPQGFSLAAMVLIHPTATGRGANSNWWCGLSNVFWHLDREKGVAGIVASQILPFAGMSSCVRER